MGDAHRYRLDDLRHLGAGLLAGLGVPPARASALVSGLLWYEAAGAPQFGIEALPGWLAAIESGQVDPKAVGTIVKEHTATAVLDGKRGLGPLILARAGQIAAEKAREVGVGTVRVMNVGRIGATAEVASEIAVGPMVAEVAATGSLALAVPVEGSVPAVFDTALAPTGRTSLPGWAALAEGADGWLVTARAVSAFESLGRLHEAVHAMLKSAAPIPGEVRPDAWQARRLEQLERGISLGKGTEKSLRSWAGRLGVAWPS
ncbi:MAG TPA: Ldh family oxidoreductase [Isosphaeraceae bacterium]